MASEKSSSAVTPPLAAEVNAATRSLHTQLNRLITTRLPLCLPPHASDSSAYTTGLLHFTHIYLTFESLFHDLTAQANVTNPALSLLLEDPWVHVPTPSPAQQQQQEQPQTEPQSPSDSQPLPESTSQPTPATPDTTEHDTALQKSLAALLPPGLPRSKRLIADLATLAHRSPTDIVAELSRFPTPGVQRFAARIREEATRRPHVLIAYAWCFYMAVFSGGRWIRTQLMGAPGGFWGLGGEDDGVEGGEVVEQEKEKEKGGLAEKGLSFFHFEGTEDGEDIKATFKQRLAAAEELLTPVERAEVIEEAKALFLHCEELVAELDAAFATPETVKKNPRPPVAPEVLEIPETAAPDLKVWKTGPHPASQLTPRQTVWAIQSSLAAIAIAVSCASWYAMCRFGTPA